jgi:hypothetical protein
VMFIRVRPFRQTCWRTGTDTLSAPSAGNAITL